MTRWVLMVAMVLGIGSLVGFAGCAAMHKEGNEMKVKMEDCPKAVQDTLTKEAQGGQITAVVKEEKDGKASYEADAVIGGKNYEIKVAADGTLLKKKLEEKKDEKK